MIYADYDYYVNSYFGRSIQEDDFLRFALRASQYIDYITMGKAEARADLEAVKMCCCALAEKYQSIEMAEIEEKGKSELYRTAQQHLAPTGILYRGGRCCR